MKTILSIIMGIFLYIIISKYNMPTIPSLLLYVLGGLFGLELAHDKKINL